jgi:signal transduction histidine kinase
MKAQDKKLPRQRARTHSLAFAKGRLTRFDQVARALAVELGCARERERQKIAADLHDQIGQNLVLAKIRLDALKSSLGNEYAVLVTGVSELIQCAIRDTRSLIHELYPEWLSQLSLKEALNWLAEETTAKYGLRCETKFGSAPKLLKKDIREFLFQAVRELLVNVAKHARARRVSIACDCGKGGMQLRVTDDGEGFDPLTSFTPSPTSGGFGLMIIRARLGLMGGNLYIDSHVGAGTSVTITLPERIC